MHWKGSMIEYFWSQGILYSTPIIKGQMLMQNVFTTHSWASLSLLWSSKVILEHFKSRWQIYKLGTQNNNRLFTITSQTFHKFLISLQTRKQSTNMNISHKVTISDHIHPFFVITKFVLLMQLYIMVPKTTAHYFLPMSWLTNGIAHSWCLSKSIQYSEKWKKLPSIAITQYTLATRWQWHIIMNSLRERSHAILCVK